MSEGFTVRRNSFGPIVKLGDGNEQVKAVTGVYLGRRPGDYGKPLYDFGGEGGESFTVPHSNDMEQLTAADVGKLVRVSFEGRAATKKGYQVKRLAVAVCEHPTEEMKKKYPHIGTVTAVPPKKAETGQEDDDLPF